MGSKNKNNLNVGIKVYLCFGITQPKINIDTK